MGAVAQGRAFFLRDDKFGRVRLDDLLNGTKARSCGDINDKSDTTVTIVVLKQKRRQQITVRSVRVQAPCTYTEVEGSLNPRFTPLAETAHGVFLTVPDDFK